MSADEAQAKSGKASFSFKRVGLTVLAIFIFSDLFLMHHGIIPSLLFGGQRTTRELARRAQCRANMTTLARLAADWAARHPLEDVTLDAIVVGKGIDDPRLLRCPSAEEAVYQVNLAGLSDPERPLITEAAGTHPRVSFRAPSGHNECYWRNGHATTRFIKDADAPNPPPNKEQ